MTCTISIISMFRDESLFLPIWDDMWNRIEKHIKTLNMNITLEYYLYENMSIDNTRDLLTTFMHSRKGNVLGKTDQTLCRSGIRHGIFLKRGQRMAKLRTAVKQSHGILNTHITILIDSNVVVSPQMFIKMINRYKEYSNDSYPVMLTPFTVELGLPYNHYYDTLAFSHSSYTHKETGNTCLFKQCKQCILGRKRKGIHIPETHLLSCDTDMISVQSAFGGFAIMDTPTYLRTPYHNTCFCEHIPFCKIFRERGGFIYCVSDIIMGHIDSRFLKKQQCYDTLINRLENRPYSINKYKTVYITLLLFLLVLIVLVYISKYIKKKEINT
jgi:hypothetical protein